MSYILLILELYIFYIILFFINSKYIAIPFKVQDYTYDDGDKLILKYIYKDILVKFLVGTPPQNVHLSVGLGEYSTFIVDKSVDEFEEAKFDDKISSTYKALSDPESFIFQTYSRAIKSKDDWMIEGTNTKINNLYFNLATELDSSQFYCTYCEVMTQPGILGLLIAQVKNFEENINDLNFIDQLKSKDLISSYDFYFNFENQKSGNLIIGSRPHELEKEKYNGLSYVATKTSSTNGELDWSIKFDQIYFGNKKMQQIKPMILRIEFGLITGYYEWENVLINEFFSKYIDSKICFKENVNDLGSYLHYFYCNKNVDLSEFKPFIFTINEFNYNFTLTKDDLFLDVGDKYVFMMAFGGFSELILGYPFLKKYQLIFNQNTKTIGFYLENKEENTSFMSAKYIITICILSIFLICLIIVAFLFFWKKKKDKQNATELLDDQFHDNKKSQENSIIDDNVIN